MAKAPHAFGAPAQKWGGRRGAALLKRRKAVLTREDTNAKFDSDSGMGSESDGDETEESNSSVDSGRPQGLFAARSSRSFGNTAIYQAVSDQFDQEEDGIIEGIFPGNLDLSLISQFVAHHFARVWDDYVPFNQWADDKALQDPDTPILIAEWKALKTEESKSSRSLLPPSWRWQFINKLHNIIHKQWIYRNTFIHYRGTDGLTTLSTTRSLIGWRSTH